jgi:RNA polymerase sigma-70 factor (ECF subfamily)
VAPTADWSSRLDNPSIQTELRLGLSAAINELPPASQSMLVLRDVEALSNVAIAAVLVVTASVVKARVHRARLFVRKQLSDAMTTTWDAAVTPAA